VLVTGGLGVNGIYDPLASAELYDPTKAKWTATGSMSEGQVAFTATLLPNGEVLVAGGQGIPRPALPLPSSTTHSPGNGRPPAT
jgi:hypothetical protein